MAGVDLVAECKKALGIAGAVTAFDDRITQKAAIVKGYMQNAGVSDAVIDSDMAVGVIAMGVIDMWSLEGGAAKFSPAFHTLLAQLSFVSQPAPEDDEDA
jgi:hypothetical protein